MTFTAVFRHYYGNARYFLDVNRPLWHMLPWYSAPTVMHGIFWMVSATLAHATVVLSPHGNVRYFWDGNRPLWYILLRYSVYTFYIFWGYSRVRVMLRCQYVHRPQQSPDLELKLNSGEHNKRQCPDHRQTYSQPTVVCVCVFFPFILDVEFVGSTSRGTQDFSSTFVLRCVRLFSSREGFSRSFPSSTVKSN